MVSKSRSTRTEPDRFATRELWADLRFSEGLSGRWLVVCFFVAALLIFSRSPGLFLDWQFYAEDGRTWFQQAYNLGWLRSLAIPDAGYLNSLQRLLTGPALLVPFRLAPLLQALEGLVLQALPAAVLLSPRCRNWASLPARGAFALLYLGLPCSTEVQVVLTDSQWHFALIEVLLAFGEAPRTRAAYAADTLLFTLGGFCGPFCLLLAPLTVVFWLVRRQRWSLGITAMMSFGASVQIWELVHGISQRAGDLGVSAARLARILGGNLFADALLGEHSFALQWPLALNVAAAVALCLLFACALLRATLPLRLMIVYSVLIVAGALHAPMIQGQAPQWELLLHVTTSRYWFFPMLSLLWCIAWLALDGNAQPESAPERDRGGVWMSRIAAILLLVSIFGVVHDWRVRPLPDEHFAASAERFAEAPGGAHVLIPEYPQGWQMELIKH